MQHDDERRFYGAWVREMERVIQEEEEAAQRRANGQRRRPSLLHRCTGDGVVGAVLVAVWVVVAGILVWLAGG